MKIIKLLSLKFLMCLLGMGSAHSAPKQQYRIVDSYIEGAHKVCIYERVGTRGDGLDGETQSITISKHKQCSRYYYF